LPSRGEVWCISVFCRWNFWQDAGKDKLKWLKMHAFCWTEDISVLHHGPQIDEVYGFFLITK
jgi:hypothetical protein